MGEKPCKHIKTHGVAVTVRVRKKKEAGEKTTLHGAGKKPAVYVFKVLHFKKRKVPGGWGGGFFTARLAANSVLVPLV